MAPYKRKNPSNQGKEEASPAGDSAQPVEMGDKTEHILEPLPTVSEETSQAEDSAPECEGAEVEHRVPQGAGVQVERPNGHDDANSKRIASGQIGAQDEHNAASTSGPETGHNAPGSDADSHANGSEYNAKFDEEADVHTLVVSGPSVNTTPRSGKGSKSAELFLGRTLDDRYEIIGHLGKGGMSSVYKARDLTLDKVVALKTILPHLVEQEMTVKRFKREALSVSTLKHKNIAEVYACEVSADGIPYIAMEYLEGTTLSAVLERETRLPYNRAIHIFCQIADALQHAHSHGVIHRDLKPSNVMLQRKDGQDDVVGIVDFGLAKLMPQADVQGSTLTHTGDVFGSPPYMSPEQCVGQKIDHRTDIYSLGCLMYETLTGQPPLLGETPVSTVVKQIGTIPPSMFDKCPEAKIPDKLESIVFKALQKELGSRQQSMGQLQSELKEFLKMQEAGTEYKPVGMSTKISQLWVRHRKVMYWVSGAFAAAFCYFWWWWWGWIHVYREGVIHLVLSIATVIIFSFVAYYIIRGHKWMTNLCTPTPVWQLTWHNGQQCTETDPTASKATLQAVISLIEAGASIENRPKQQELRTALEMLMSAGCIEDVQYSSIAWFSNSTALTGLPA